MAEFNAVIKKMQAAAGVQSVLDKYQGVFDRLQRDGFNYGHCILSALNRCGFPTDSHEFAEYVLQAATAEEIHKLITERMAITIQDIQEECFRLVDEAKQASEMDKGTIKKKKEH